MSNNVLVTGGGGYIGSILVPILLGKNYNVTVVDNFMYKENSLAINFINPNLKVINGDIRDKELIKTEIKNNDIIIHLASYVGAPLCDRDPITAEQVNKDSSFFIIDQLSNNQIMLMPTTNSAYGTGDKNNFCDENSKLHPISNYAIQKVQIEKKLMEKNNAISFRLATVFGMSPRMRLDLLVNDFTYRAVNDGFIVLYESHFKRNYIHVIDVSKVFLFGIDNFNLMKNNIYNVGLSSANVSKLELCKKIKEQIPDFYITDAELQKDKDQRNYLVSNDKIEKIGFKPDITLDAGITELIKGYKTLKSNFLRNA